MYIRKVIFGMELNEIETFAIKTSRMIRSYFGKRMDDSSIYDIVEKNNYRAFKINFIAYDYAGVRLIYENDVIEFQLFLNDEQGKVISKPNSHYSEIQDWENYLKEIMTKIESHIPEKYLKAKGWR